MTDQPNTHTFQVLHLHGPQPCGQVAFEARRILRPGESYADVAIAQDPHKPLTCGHCSRALWAGDMAYAVPGEMAPAT